MTSWPYASGCRPPRPGFLHSNFCTRRSISRSLSMCRPSGRHMTSFGGMSSTISVHSSNVRRRSSFLISHWQPSALDFKAIHTHDRVVILVDFAVGFGLTTHRHRQVLPAPVHCVHVALELLVVAKRTAILNVVAFSRPVKPGTCTVLELCPAIAINVALLAS